MANRKLSGDTAALVAAQLTQAQMALSGGLFAGRKPGATVSVAPHSVEKTYLRFLDFVENGAVLPEE
ncbi:hypothetical protein [Sphingomonas sp. TX0522]|uniref:hypothetical protein n=1 Tax=Sphingomonas sp. TX0522 TaxID=2479205 RepID=UPI0018DEF316|nr:hypothetical protein [Sphingomonas sp. TX0522]MBI0530331.1 hypothetical protein [Sphingomonas sp. TX0522]